MGVVQHKRCFVFFEGTVDVVVGDSLDYFFVLVVERLLFVEDGQVLEHYHVGAFHFGAWGLRFLFVSFLE